MIIRTNDLLIVPLKIKLFFFAALLTCSFRASSQNPPRGAFQIIINTQLSKEENMLLINSVLPANGFQVSIMDTINYYIESNRKRLPGFTASYHLIFIVKDLEITVFGKLTDTYMPNTLSKSVYLYIINLGPRNSAQRTAFGLMHAFALKIGTDLRFIVDREFRSDEKKKEEYDDVYR